MGISRKLFRGHKTQQNLYNPDRKYNIFQEQLYKEPEQLNDFFASERTNEPHTNHQGSYFCLYWDAEMWNDKGSEIIVDMAKTNLN